jgi:DNA replication protein DnaC
VEETMNLIVNTRYNERRMTIFTSNYKDIPEDDNPNSLLFRIGFRMRSRLHEMCEFSHLEGADYRERPDNATAADLVALWKRRQMSDAPSTLPTPRSTGRQARAQLKDRERDGRADLKWPGGRAGS